MTDFLKKDPRRKPENQDGDVSNQRLVRGLSRNDLEEIARVLELLRGWGDDKPSK